MKGIDQFFGLDLLKDKIFTYPYGNVYGGKFKQQLVVCISQLLNKDCGGNFEHK